MWRLGVQTDLKRRHGKGMLVKNFQIAAFYWVALTGCGAGLVLTMPKPARADEGETIEQAAPQERPAPNTATRAKTGEDTGRPVHSLTGHKDRITSVAYSPDGRWIATAAWDGTARLWDTQTGKEERRLDMPEPQDYHPGHLSRIMFSPDNEFVVVAQQAAPNEPGVIVWNPRTGEKIHEFRGGTGGVGLSADGRLLACAADNVLRLYELPAGKAVHEIPGLHSIRSVPLTFSPDGKTLFSKVRVPRPPLGNGSERMGFDPEVSRAWEVATGKERRSVLKGEIFAFSPDGRALANNGGTTIILQENATGGLRGKLIGHSQGVSAAAFSPDGRTLASASMDGTVRLWDVFAGKELGRFGKEVEQFKGGWVLSVAFSPDGRTIVSGGLDKTAHIWDVSRITGRPRAVADRSPAELEADWKDLAGDAAAGYAALGRLVLSPERAVPFLGKQLQGTKPVDSKRIERLIADLDSDRFPVREQATEELAALGEHAGPVLRKALSGGPSAEARRRLETLLDRLDGGSLSVETVRQIRTVEALESIANPEARRLLDKLAAGPAETRLAQEAKSAGGRLAKRTSVVP
jgi:WD40 repeat protein